jgi:hypothetical protein
MSESGVPELAPASVHVTDEDYSEFSALLSDEPLEVSVADLERVRTDRLCLPLVSFLESQALTQVMRPRFQ